jgi:predicted AlkP superfamily pyrophosphatase or phosphodiesterase
LRPDAISPARCPNIESLRRRGAWTFKAQSVMPSITLPCHMSIFHSLPPSQHGILTNDDWPPEIKTPGLVEVARAAGLKCAFFYNWEPLRNLSRPGCLTFSYFRENCKITDGDEVNALEAARFIEQIPLDFAFVYFGVVDEIGHVYGWMSDQYLAQVESADRALATVLKSLPDDSSILLQSDHGGHDRGHGTDLPDDMTIPWIVTGPHVRSNFEIPDTVSLLDTAPTLALLLSITPDPAWQGHAIESIFKAAQS